MPRKLYKDDELLDDLPPMDDDDQDDKQEEVQTDLDLEAEELDRDLDDSVASELQIGELVDGDDDASEPGTEDPREIDIGAPDIDIQEDKHGERDDDAAGVPGDDAAVGIDTVADAGVSDDADDQPGASGDDIDESALPQLDSDDEADLPGGVVIDESVDISEKVALPSWALVRWEQIELRADESPSSWTEATLSAMRADLVAKATSKGDLSVSRDSGESWSTCMVTAELTSIAIAPIGSSLAVLGTIYLEAEDRSYLFCCEVGGEPVLVADLSTDVSRGTDEDGDESDSAGPASALGWDDERGWLWVAGPSGLQAWRPRFAA
ncbi:MAG: hypothetical protein HY898_32175 [Deltaproteobacteria bacterium]|nr:hypothetical protein [Deltaproteobacteria bacterium]